MRFRGQHKRAEMVARMCYHGTEWGRKMVYEFDHDDAGRFARGYSSRDFVRRIDTQEIFRELIAQEVRSGRLTPSRRRRIIRYAAQLHLSAVETGRLIAECRDEALQSDNPEEMYHALRLVEPPQAEMPVALKVAIVAAGAIVVNLLLSRWL